LHKLRTKMREDKASILTIQTRSQSYDRELHLYNASAVKIYNATGGLVCFEKKKILLHIMITALAYKNTCVVVVNFDAMRSTQALSKFTTQLICSMPV
jgi:hypothetical protein